MSIPKSKSAKGTPTVALLRGINVGGNNMLPMVELIAFFKTAGASEVRSYIQSGNVVFHAPPRLATKIADAVRKSVAERFGFDIPIVIRTLEQMEETSNENPFLKEGSVEKNLHVLFLADVPEAASVGKLDPNRSSPDRFHVRGRDVYLDLPNGAGRTKLTNAYFDSKLATISTGRNWATVCKLLHMMRD